jgi:putative effector of murein hydrolase LrgA (UPF0299 family)
VLLLFQLLGEGIACLPDRPIPGPVMGTGALHFARPAAP